MQYYILSLTHTNSEALVWWRPENSGYTIYLESAGKYDGEVVNSQKGYYDNKRETVAIPCNMAEEFCVKIVSSDHMEKFSKYTKISS